MENSSRLKLQNCRVRELRFWLSLECLTGKNSQTKSNSIVLLHLMKMLQIIAGIELFSYINLKVQLIQIQRRALEH